MTVLILVIVTTWSFGISMDGGYGAPQKIIVSSPEEAAIIVYKDKNSGGILCALQCEPDRKTYSLYEIDLGSEKITPLKIPKLKFEAPS